MKVTRGFCTNKEQPMTSPFPEADGVYFALHGGDVCDPVGFGTNWFKPPYPEKVRRWASRYNALPFFSWKYKSLKGYVGFKCYGVDAPEYKDWLCPPAEVYDGSLALCLTIRNGLTALPFIAAAALLAAFIF